MQVIDRYQVQPASEGVLVNLPTGPIILGVTQDIHSFYLSVLGEHQGSITPRRIKAFMDGDPFPDDTEMGVYIGTTPQPGTVNRWHFFDCGPAEHNVTASRGAARRIGTGVLDYGG